MKLVMISIVLLYIKCASWESNDVYIEDNVRFAGYFLQYGKFFEAFLMILDLYTPDTVLFSNMNKDLANELKLNETNTSLSLGSVYKANIELNGVIVHDFPFNLIEDNDSEIDENDINGIIGLQMNKDGSNHFMDILKERGFINKRIIYLTFGAFTQISFMFDLSKKEINEYYYCNDDITRKDYLWSCSMSHIAFGDDYIPLPIDTISLFTPRNLYSEIPYDYIPLFQQRLSLDKEDCDYKQVDNATIIVCNYTKREMLLKNQDKTMTFVINRIGIEMNNDYLFQSYDQNRTMLMFSFINTTKTKWNFGYFFFQDNSLSLDYDKKSLGFRSLSPNNIYKNHTQLYYQWKTLSNAQRYATIMRLLLYSLEISLCIVMIIIIIMIGRRYHKMRNARNLIVEQT